LGVADEPRHDAKDGNVMDVGGLKIIHSKGPKKT